MSIAAIARLEPGECGIGAPTIEVKVSTDLLLAGGVVAIFSTEMVAAVASCDEGADVGG